MDGFWTIEQLTKALREKESIIIGVDKGECVIMSLCDDDVDRVGKSLRRIKKGDILRLFSGSQADKTKTNLPVTPTQLAHVLKFEQTAELERLANCARCGQEFLILRTETLPILAQKEIKKLGGDICSNCLSDRECKRLKEAIETGLSN